MAEPNGALVSLYAQRNNAIKNKGDVAGLNAKITEFVEKNNVTEAVRRASSAAASNIQSNNRGADIKKKSKKVPVVTIGVGMAEVPKGKKGPMKMAMGGMANGKKHMYLNEGALVTENLNPGLKALAKERPDVVKKILNK